ncbi:MAG: helix-turn-helix domain-containing protein [Burkholderiales bacterium]
MDSELPNTLKQRRTELGLTQREVARRGGIEQRQVSTFERGGDVTLSTLLKLTSALEMELLPVPREGVPSVRSVITQATTTPPSQRQGWLWRGPDAITQPSQPPPSLLDLYGVPDDDEEKSA